MLLSYMIFEKEIFCRIR